MATPNHLDENFSSFTIMEEVEHPLPINKELEDTAELFISDAITINNKLFNDGNIVWVPVKHSTRRPKTDLNKLLLQHKGLVPLHQYISKYDDYESLPPAWNDIEILSNKLNCIFSSYKHVDWICLGTDKCNYTISSQLKYKNPAAYVKSLGKSATTSIPNDESKNPPAENKTNLDQHNNNTFSLPHEDPLIQNKKYYDDRETDPQKQHNFLFHQTNLGTNVRLHQVIYGKVNSEDEISKIIEQTKSDINKNTADLLSNHPNIINEYNKANNQFALLLTCACCGMREYQESNLQPLSKLNVLKFDSENEHDKIKLSKIQHASTTKDPISGISHDKVFSYYVENDSHFHLHPEFVEKDIDKKSPSKCHICPSCWTSISKNNKRPKSSISYGFDFGWLNRIGIPSLTAMEKMALSTARTYMTLFKFSLHSAGKGEQATMRGQSICFPQPDSVEVLDNVQVKNLNIHDNISILFVGPQLQFEQRLANALPFGDHFEPRHEILVRVNLALNALDPNRNSKGFDSESSKLYFSSKGEDGKYHPESLMDKLINNASFDDSDNVSNTDLLALSNDPAGALPQAFVDKQNEEEASSTNTNSNINIPVTIDHIYIGPQNGIVDDDPVKEFLVAVKESFAFNKVNPDNKVKPCSNVVNAKSEEVKRQEPIKIGRDTTAFNEYTSNSTLIAKSYPHLFPTGVGPAQQGPLSISNSKHLLLQFNAEFGSCAQLTFQLFNQYQRHCGSTSISIHVKNNSKSFVLFKELMEDMKSFEKDLDNAILYPTLQTSIKLIKLLQDILTVFRPGISYSSASRSAEIGTFINSGRFFGRAVIFSTTAPDPIGNCNDIRRCFSSTSNICFPATESDFITHLKKSKVDKSMSFKLITNPLGKEDLIKFTYSKLMTLMTSNATATAAGYLHDLNNTFDIIYGNPLTSTTRTSSVLKQGIFGFNSASFSVNECNGKGWLHNHALIHGGLSGWLTDALASFTSLHEPLQKYIDSIVTCSLPSEVHKQSMLRRVCGFPPYRAGHNVPPQNASFENNDTSSQSFMSHTYATVEGTQLHLHHGSRCHKGAVGKYQCAQSYPKQCVESTTPVKLTRLNNDLIILINQKAKPQDLTNNQFTLYADYIENKVGDLFNTDCSAFKIKEFNGNSVVSLVENNKEGTIKQQSNQHSTSTNPQYKNPLSTILKEEDMIVVEPLRPTINVDKEEKKMNYDLNTDTLIKELLDVMENEEGEEALPTVQNNELLIALNALKTACASGTTCSETFLDKIIQSLPPKYKHVMSKVLSQRNGKVTDFNIILNGLRGCNTAVYYLSTHAAAKVSVFYLLKYITKDPVDRSATAPLAVIAREAIQNLDSFGSVAEDAGTSKRSAQYVLNRIMNKFNGQGEYSLSLAAACLLGTPAEPVTHNSQFLNVNAAIKYAVLKVFVV